VFIRFAILPELTIIIRDDGIGFDKNKIKPYSNGLTNMQKRMKELGGSFEIESNNGTTIKLSAPMPS
jgi:signal transduction histidine kinase